MLMCAHAAEFVIMTGHEAEEEEEQVAKTALSELLEAEDDDSPIIDKETGVYGAEPIIHAPCPLCCDSLYPPCLGEGSGALPRHGISAPPPLLWFFLGRAFIGCSLVAYLLG